MDLEKCEFFQTSLMFLVYTVGSNSLRTDLENASAMVNYPLLRTATEVKRFIGQCSRYSCFIKDFPSLMSPINDLKKGRRKSQPIAWTAAAETSFVKIEELLISAPILVQPIFLYHSQSSAMQGAENVVPDAFYRIRYEPNISMLNPFNVDIECIDLWYSNLREKTIKLPEKYPQWKVEDDFVFKFVPNNLPVHSDLPEWNLLVPSPQVNVVIQNCHNPPTAGHFYFYRTLNRIQ